MVISEVKKNMEYKNDSQKIKEVRGFLKFQNSKFALKNYKIMSAFWIFLFEDMVISEVKKNMEYKNDSQKIKEVRGFLKFQNSKFALKNPHFK